MNCLKYLSLSQEEVRSCLPMRDAIKAVKEAYMAFAEGRELRCLR